MARERRTVFDSHLHLWSLNSPFHEWPDASLPLIYRDFGMIEFAALVPPPHRAMLVQAQPDSRETEWLLSIAAREARIAGVVGWTAFDAADAPNAIARLATQPKLVGLRPMLQDMLDADWILGPDVDAAFGAMMEHGLRFDALIRPRHLPALRELARRWPALPIVIDHAAKPDFCDAIDRWREDMAALATMPNVWCKLSGILTELPEGTSASVLTPCLEHVLSVFPDRVMWGSDWPVLLLSGWRYDAWLNHALETVRKTHPAQLEAIFQTAGVSFYGV